MLSNIAYAERDIHRLSVKIDTNCQSLVNFGVEYDCFYAIFLPDFISGRKFSATVFPLKCKACIITIIMYWIVAA